MSLRFTTRACASPAIRFSMSPTVAAVSTLGLRNQEFLLGYGVTRFLFPALLVGGGASGGLLLLAVTAVGLGAALVAASVVGGGGHEKRSVERGGGGVLSGGLPVPDQMQRGWGL